MLVRYPTLLQINTRVWLRRLSDERGGRVTLADVDNETLDRFSELGFDWIWLLSVWRTGAAGAAVSRSIPEWRAEFQSVLPDLTDDDICGSGFAISAYEVSDSLGGDIGLAKFRAKLAARGIRLMLDFVPNHTALDHPWVSGHPDYYVAGDEDDISRTPRNYVRIDTADGPRILAHGRDPNFPGWPDTLQLNYANPMLQVAQIDQLRAIAEKCDGVRCDMAMLELPEIFERTWGVNSEPFWPKAIAAVRGSRPDFTFMAEVYWDLEWSLQQQGFSYCYDKRLYDRLKSGAAGPVRQHLLAGLDYQERLVRFLENHDEPRAANVFAWPQHQAAAIVTFLLPGLRFFHHGQSTGAKRHVPTHLCRGPVEADDPNVATFYTKFLRVLKNGSVLRDGSWQLVTPAPAWSGNASCDSFISFVWSGEGGRRVLVVVNYAPTRGQCRVVLPFPDLKGRRLLLSDEMGPEVYERDGTECVEAGLYIDHLPWRFNLFRIETLS